MFKAKNTHLKKLCFFTVIQSIKTCLWTLPSCPTYRRKHLNPPNHPTPSLTPKKTLVGRKGMRKDKQRKHGGETET